ncbi:MAG: cobalt ECF transporter T component CbiQ [Gammaproteobacteria bacterium]|nr:cobalt ECF transporter T component CbiQ [Candidatus Lokiarchaeota archaeon]MCJ7557866.1 cobalt ECF transporter T component CbiQ [Gammaproteobacteria bacterium]
MHIHFLDPYHHRSSPVHHLDPRVKLLLALAFILTCALTPPGAWPVYILLLAMVLSVEILSDLGISYVQKRSLLALPFILAAFPVIFTIRGEPLASFSIASWTLTVTQPGVERFISIALKSWISVQAAVVLAASTPFPALLAAMRAIHIPRLLVAIFGLMWRYLFVLTDEALRLMRARAARSGQSTAPGAKTGGSLAWRARVTGGMAGSLFLRALERSDRIYMAMVSRGYDGEVRTIPLPSLNGMQITILALGLFALALLLMLAFIL